MSPAPAAVLFDLDGTLIDTKSLYLEAYRDALRPHVGRGLSHEDIMALRPTSEIDFLRRVVGERELEACRRTFHESYKALHDRLFGGVYPGVRPVLDLLRDASVPIGVVTGKSRRSWEITRAACALGGFDVLVFDDDVRAPKPDPHGLEMALAHLDVQPGGAFYVGDSTGDMRAARAAGVQPVAALWARAPERRERFLAAVREQQPLVVERPEDLPRQLGLR